MIDCAMYARQDNVDIVVVAPDNRSTGAIADERQSTVEELPVLKVTFQPFAVQFDWLTS